MRLGFTLHEMLISMTVLGGVMALVGHLATGQLRLFRGIGEVVVVQAQVGQAGAIAAALLRDVSPGAGENNAATDSALELRRPIGTGVACGGPAGRIVVPAPVAGPGNVLASFIEPPGLGDRASVLFDDSLGTTWLAMDPVAPPAASGPCAEFPGARATWTIPIGQTIAVPAGSVVRFTRPFRLGLYRSSDGLWYLGARDWNGEAARFNPVQPLAGPLLSYDPDPGRTGLHFGYWDATGEELREPVDPGRIATIVVTSRAAAKAPVRVPGLAARTGAFEDSVTVVVSLRNAR